MRRTRRSLTLFLLLNSCLLGLGGGCAAKPVVAEFDGKWEFVERPGPSLKACLVEDDVAKLRELLIRCKAAQQ